MVFVCNIEEIKLLQDLFKSEVPDKDSNRLIWKLCDEQHRWHEAQDILTILREKNLKAINQQNKVKEAQYCFEEVVAQTLFNLTRPSSPFDPDAPYWVIKNALSLAKALKIPTEKVVTIVY